jgi:hypothetical protein
MVPVAAIPILVGVAGLIKVIKKLDPCSHVFDSVVMLTKGGRVRFRKD